MNDSNKMATYFYGLPRYTVLIGITSWEPTHSRTQNATSALFAIGVNVAGLQYRGRVSFVAQIGQPAMTVSQVAGPGSAGTLPVNVTGSLYFRHTFDC